MTPEQLFQYANQYARKAEADGKGTKYPTFRETAQRFRVKHADIEQACEDWDQSNGYLAPAVGVRCGAAIGTFTSKGDWLVEAYA